MVGFILQYLFCNIVVQKQFKSDWLSLELYTEGNVRNDIGIIRLKRDVQFNGIIYRIVVSVNVGHIFSRFRFCKANLFTLHGKHIQEIQGWYLQPF